MASVQLESAAGNKQANLAKMEAFLQRAATQGVEFITFPECRITGCWFLRNLSRDQLRALAEPVFDGPTSPA